MIQQNLFLRQLLLTVLALTVGLCAVVWLTQSLRFLDYMVNRGLSGKAFVTLVSLMAPGFLMVVLPLSLPLAVIMVYRRSQADNELVAWQSAGFSPWQLAFPAIVTALLVSIAGLLVSMYWLPDSYRAFKNLQEDIRNNYATVLLQEGSFTPVTDAITIYVGKRHADGVLEDILVHDQRKPEQPVTVLAKRGRLLKIDGKPVVEAENGNRQEMEASTGRLGILYFDKYYLDLGLLMPGARQRELELQERTISQLWRSTDGHERAAGLARLAAPLAAMLFLLPALWATVLQPYRRQPSRWPLLATGAVIVAGQGILVTAQNAGLGLSATVTAILLLTIISCSFVFPALRMLAR